MSNHGIFSGDFTAVWSGYVSADTCRFVTERLFRNFYGNVENGMSLRITSPAGEMR